MTKVVTYPTICAAVFRSVATVPIFPASVLRSVAACLTAARAAAFHELPLEWVVLGGHGGQVAVTVQVLPTCWTVTLVGAGIFCLYEAATAFACAWVGMLVVVKVPHVIKYLLCSRNV